MKKLKWKRLIALIAACAAFTACFGFSLAGCGVSGETTGGTEQGGSGGSSQQGNSGNAGESGNGSSSAGESGSSGGESGGESGDESEEDEGTGALTPTIPVSDKINVTEAGGDLEAAYLQWEALTGADWYNVYYKISGGSFVRLDDPLVRQYTTYYRADAVGLKAGVYSMKIVPVNGDGEELEEDSVTVDNIQVEAHDRSGYAFVNNTSGATASGAYNMDGTLRENAIVLYVTAETFHTVSLEIGGTTVTGLDSILNEGYKENKGATLPLCVRIIGSIGNETDGLSTNASGDLNIKGVTQGVTVEGIGNDATANGWGFHITGSSNVEIRNIGLMNSIGGTKDGIGFENSCHHVWVHNCDFYYGKDWGGDQKKGDGALDSKKTDYATYSYNHFWDSGKCNLLGNAETENGTGINGDNTHLTYHHNWYDHSDSRHPRVRTATVHIYNNYFDGNAKYGVGVTKGASAFVENNYFRSTATMKPMMSSLQGTDRQGEGTFSSEAGGMIKAYGNTFDGDYALITQNDTTDKTDIDCYLASSRDEQVSAEYSTKSGGNTYNNFDTASDFYSYTPDSAEEAKVKVEKYAGRLQGGDIEFEFDDATEDANYDVIPELRALLTDYSKNLTLCKVGAIAVSDSNLSGGSTETGGESGTAGSAFVEGAITYIPATDGVNGTSGITVTGGSYKSSSSAVTIGDISIAAGKGLKIDSTPVISFTTTEEMELTLYVSGEKSIMIDDTAYTPEADVGGYYKIVVRLSAGSHTVKKGSGENVLYMLCLAPVSS